MITAAAVVGYLIAVFLRGWALIWLWTWFLVPFGLPQIGFWHACGISLTVAFLTYEYNKDSEDAKQEAIVGLFKSIFISVIALGVGFVYQLFM